MSDHVDPNQPVKETEEDNLTPLEAALRSHFEQYHPVDGTPRVTHRDSEHGFVTMSRLAGV